MRRIATAVAAIALLAGAAHAQGNGKGNDKGNQGGGRPAAAAVQGGGQGNAKASNADRGNGEGQANAQGNAAREQRGQSAQTNQGNGNKPAQAVQRASDDRGQGNDNRTVVVDRRGAAVVNAPDRSFIAAGSRGLIAGCPPGLAKKNPPCVPPGQARNEQRRLFALDRPDWWGLTRLGDGRYTYDNGYLMRLDADGQIGGYIPLLGGALSIGNAWPSNYEPVRLPDYYANYYNLGPSDSYRYADNVIYRVDPQTAAITSIAALLTGDDFSVGQAMPRGYDVYNVPSSYRDRYVDTPDALYRYNDGYVYQVDPKTRLVAAAIELLAT